MQFDIIWILERKMFLKKVSSGSNAQGELRVLEGRRVSSKCPSRDRDGDEGVAGKRRE